jgi:hypothetical protein
MMRALAGSLKSLGARERARGLASLENESHLTNSSCSQS